MHPFAKEEIERTYVDVHDIVPPLRYEGPYKKAIDVADWFGFRLIPQVKVEKADRDAKGDEDRIALIRNYLEHGLDGCTQPVHLCHTAKTPYKQELQLRLDILGTDQTIAELLLIYTTLMILREHGFDELTLAVNSVGGKVSKENFIKELANYSRNYINDLDIHCREAMKDDVLLVMHCATDRCREIFDQGPQSIAFLSEPSRRRFYDILEGLEALGIDYEINNRLLGNQHTTNHTVFEIRQKETDAETPPLAAGERYDYLAKRAGLGRHIPGIGSTLILQNIRSTRESLKPYKINKSRKHTIYVVQLGMEAKRRVIETTELLRHADIPHLALVTENRLNEQLAIAKHLEAPVLVIIGHKEVLDGTAIVRDVETRSQVSIPHNELPRYLTRFKRRYA